MAQQDERELEFDIEKLTDSIESSLSGERFRTEINQLSSDDLALMKAADWIFDWRAETQRHDREVFKLTMLESIASIQGLVSLSVQEDHVYMNLIESASFNKGRNKLYLGVSGNLVAYCCKLSIENGFDGYVAFKAKTKLIKHYQKILGAIHIGAQQMIIAPPASTRLVNKYFKS